MTSSFKRRAARRDRALVVLLVLVMLLVSSTVAPAQQPVISREAEIKAGIVTILGKLVKWPGNAAPTDAKPLKIGVLGSDPFQEGAVNHLDLKVAGQNVKVERFQSLDDYKTCHVLVVAADIDIKKTLQKTAGDATLVVAQAPGLAKQGAVMNLVPDVQQNKMRLEVNPAAAKQAGLEIDSRIFRLPNVTIVR